MSEPKRYNPSSHYSADFGMAQSPAGKWVSYEDYARLKAEVERLTKAGDAMAELLFIEPGYIGSPKQEAVVQWCKLTDDKPRA